MSVPRGTRGTKPAAIQIPEPGYWWIKFACARYVPSTVAHDQPSDDYFTWDGGVTSWILVCIGDDGGLDIIGSDEGISWSDGSMVAVERGPKIEEPS